MVNQWGRLQAIAYSFVESCDLERLISHLNHPNLWTVDWPTAERATHMFLTLYNI